MRKFRFAAWCSLVAIALNSTAASAQGVFAKAVKEKYQLGSVSCYACHSRKAAVADAAAWKKNSKQFRNDFGKMFGTPLKGTDLSVQLKEVKRDDPKRAAIEAKAKAIFLEALKKVEAMKYPEGGTYAEALKAGKIADAKLPRKPQ